MIFKKTELKNGIRVVSEFHPQSRAVAMGIWVLKGTRDESKEVAGISHFLEHLVFKGTKTRSAFQIAKSLEMVGGDLNAYTTREYTVYHALVLKDHWRVSLDVLSDLVANMRLVKSDFETERSVILQEIGMGEDDLEDMIYDVYFEKTLPKHPLGKPILGDIASITHMKMAEILKYYKENYSGENIIVAAAGNIDHHEFVAGVEEFLGDKKKRRRINQRAKPVPKVVRTCIEKKSEQLHICMGFPVAGFKEKMRFEAYIVNALLGGGMTSRIYQNVREKKGLVYSVYSSLSTFEDFGCINIYAACEDKNMLDVRKTILNELKKLRKNKVKESEVELFRTQVKGAILLGSDDVDNRMTSIAINEMIFGKYKSVDSVMEEIEAVSTSSVNEFVRSFVNEDALSEVIMGAGAEALLPLVEA